MIKLIADSCCDTTEQMREDLELTLAPLTIMLADGTTFEDTLELDIPEMLTQMKKSDSVKTNCPSIEEYAKYMYRHDECLVVTIASFLSGSYNSASAARDMVLDEFPNKKIHVFDSLNACAGETRLVLYIRQLIDEGLSFEEIVEKTDSFIDRLCTMFVLEDLGNMIKNGRLSKLSGRIASVLNIYPILYKRKVGEIKMIAKVRGLKNALDRMVGYIKEWTKQASPQSVLLTLSHCEALQRAEEVKAKILSSCPAIREVIVSPTGGLSTVYANRGGIIVAFPADAI